MQYPESMNDSMTPSVLRQVAQDFGDRYQPKKLRALMVAGSGLKLEIPGWEASEKIPMGEIMPFDMHHLEGHDHSITLWRRGEESLMVMNGRFHLYQGYSPAEVVAPIRLAALLGAELMVATNATGSLDPEIPAGSLVMISDHINFQASNPLVGAWGREFGPQFPDMSDTYDPEYRKIALRLAREAGFEVFEGVYVAMLGPSFETPAEVRMLGKLGGTVVGMSTVPEVIAARQMGMKNLVISLASNPAAGLVDRALTHKEVMEAGHEAASKLRILMGRLIETIFP